MKLFDDTDAAIVTGAGNGIGRAIALALVREGVPTVFADIDAKTVAAALEQAKADAGEAIGAAVAPGRAIGWVGDLAEPSARDRLLADARAAIGPVTMLVHSASPPRHERDHVFAVDGETWRRMRAVNLDAAFDLGRALARGWADDATPGRLLLLTSLHTHTPRNLPHYSTSKAGMGMLVKEFAKSLGRYGIRVNELVPGAVAAGGFKADPALARHIPLGRLGRADDLAPLALAVLSNRLGGYVTGTRIVIDGGLSLTNWFEPPELANVV
ncbi:MAG: SDR family oxidoreductase [Burkholderiaceae bacterium]|nr:SDR family oxidoreductase [Burkholderiaceae bacterium]